MSDSIKDLSDPEVRPVERYERGLALKKAGLHKAAIEQLEMAAVDPLGPESVCSDRALP